MKNNRHVISQWSDAYLDTVQILYGAFEMLKDLTVTELCAEWQDCFLGDSRDLAEPQLDEVERGWSDAYLNTI
ncbi:MAG: hypothetical protein NTV45_06050, partial [Firmicutes bacterium]|nr:hypothetical protein [Bacillota bacterium]